MAELAWLSATVWVSAALGSGTLASIAVSRTDDPCLSANAVLGGLVVVCSLSDEVEESDDPDGDEDPDGRACDPVAYCSAVAVIPEMVRIYPAACAGKEVKRVKLVW